MTNAACWKEAGQYLAGGVNSPVRACRSVGAWPFFAARGRGAWIWDVQGRRYLDCVGSWGALILGHAHPAVLRAARGALGKGTAFGTPTAVETALARQIVRAVPSIEQLRLVSSGTEAVMSALRLARAETGRAKIIKFDGAYHGHADALLTRAGSGLATLGLPGCPGVPKAVTRDTLTLPFNDPEAVERAFRRFPEEIACVLVEPVMANIGVIPPEPGYLAALRKLTRKHRALLVFDEVITGFRVAYGGAQTLYGVTPDLTVLGKVIGGGFPVGAYGGPKRLMRRVAPSGPVYQAGTLAGHPVACAAGLATLEILQKAGTYQRLSRLGDTLAAALLDDAEEAGFPAVCRSVGALLSLFFAAGPIRNGRQARARTDAGRYAAYFRAMRSNGVSLPPSAFEGWFLSTAMGPRHIAKLRAAHREALRLLREKGRRG